MAIYKEHFTVNRKKKKAQSALYLECSFLLIKNGLPVADAAFKFCKMATVYYYYKKWSELECFDLLLEKIREKARLQMGQRPQASLGIMDSQSVRWGNNRSLNSYDGNKKVKGIKHHVVTDKNGFLLTVMLTVANIHNSKAVLLLMRTYPPRDALQA